jgi:hypothetical protein
MKKTTILIVLFLSFFCLKAQTKVPGDIVGIWNVINFDSTVNYIHIDTSAQNIWQIGRPQKILFDSAYSAPNAMITDSVNAYPANNHSFFDLYVGSFNSQMYPWDLFFDFYHKYDTDTLKDGGYITVSWDKGQTWANIIHDTNYAYYIHPPMSFYGQIPNLYSDTDTLTEGNIGFSGSSNGWIHTIMAWHGIPVKTINPADTMIIRFNFISDGLENHKEGWMIDHIRLYSVDLGGEIQELFNSNEIAKVSPNPMNDQAEISFVESFQTIQVEVYDLQGKLVGQHKYPSGNSFKFKSNGLKSGAYYLKILLDNKKIVTKKVIIEGF